MLNINKCQKNNGKIIKMMIITKKNHGQEIEATMIIRQIIRKGTTMITMMVIENNEMTITMKIDLENHGMMIEIVIDKWIGKYSDRYIEWQKDKMIDRVKKK